MKTINVSDELHTRLKNAADFCGISIQSLVTEMIERDFKNATKVKEFVIEDIKDIELYREQMENYIKFKKLNEDEFKITVITEVLKKPIIKIYHK
jgi:hypothetical protein